MSNLFRFSLQGHAENESENWASAPEGHLGSPTRRTQEEYEEEEMEEKLKKLERRGRNTV